MKKDKRTPVQKIAALKRATKRSLRLKKTQAEKPAKKAALVSEKKYKAFKFQETMNKLLQSRKL